MPSDNTRDPMTEFFGAPIDVYTRADAIADGVLFEVPEKAWRKAGFRWPVAVTQAVHGQCVAWNGDEEMEAGRLHELLWMAYLAVAAEARRGNGGAESVPFLLVFHEVESPAVRQEVRLNIAMSRAGKDGAPVLTVMFPGED
ncbi:DUF6573 family protein [Kitasatospora griseola]|uniref:DUF6573 family protein n=1 Tax=Kitasatospora griseola TaxID=2064 RepID=UPI00341DC211